MIFHPRRGEHVRIHYAASYAKYMRHDGRRGVVLAVSSGPGPRNARVEFDDGTLATFPRGNLVRDPGKAMPNEK